MAVASAAIVGKRGAARRAGLSWRMGSPQRIAELEGRISENVAWRAAWVNGAGVRDPTEFHQRGDELAADRQELQILREKHL